MPIPTPTRPRLTRGAALVASGLLVFGTAACSDEDGDGSSTDEEVEQIEDTVEDGVDEVEQQVDEGAEEGDEGEG